MNTIKRKISKFQNYLRILGFYLFYAKKSTMKQFYALKENNLKKIESRIRLELKDQKK